MGAAMEAGAPASRVTPPTTGDALVRERVLARLDAGPSCRVVWVHAPAGAGKTTAAATWLRARGRDGAWLTLDPEASEPATFFHRLGQALGRVAGAEAPAAPVVKPEHLLGLPAFARGLLGRLSRWLPGPGALVLDDYHVLPEDTPLHAALAAGLEVLEPEVPLVVLSRGAPPPAFARARANGLLRVVGGDELRFSADEVTRVAARFGVDAEEASGLHARTGGWAAGMMLLLAGGGRRQAAPSDEATLEAVFDYLAGEVLERLEPETRDLLTRVAELPEVTARAAEALTGRADAGAALSALARRQFFVERLEGERGAWRLHPLLAEFLRARARAALGEGGYAEHLAASGEALVADGQEAAGLSCLARAGRWDRLAEVACDVAPVWLAQGRHLALAPWLAQALERTPGAPLPSFWLGHALGPFQPAVARGHLEVAFEALRAAGAVPQALLAWAAIVETFMFERADFAPLDRWIAALAALGGLEALPPDPVVQLRVVSSMVGALTYRQPDHPEIEAWVEALEARLHHIPDPTIAAYCAGQLQTWYSWVGDETRLVRTAALIEQQAARLPDAPLGVAHLLTELTRSIAQWFTGRYEASLASVARAEEVAEASGIHAWDPLVAAQTVYASMGLGDGAGAARAAERAERLLRPEHHMDVSQAHVLQAWVALDRGEPGLALAHAERGRAASARAGLYFGEAMSLATLARAYEATGQAEQADEALAELRARAKGMNSEVLRRDVMLFEALRALRRGEAATRTVEALRRVFEPGPRLLGGLWPWWCLSERVSLCVAALERGVAVEQVRRVVARDGLPPSEAAELTAGWPYAVEVRALGALEVRVDGARVDAGARAPMRRLELLEVLVALGGADVAEDAVADLLWPDADGAAARAALKTTLSRLRKLLGAETVTLEGGRLSLDRRRCRVDALVVERLLAGGYPGLSPAEVAERVLTLHRGPLLPHQDASWAAAARERLDARAARCLADEGERRLAAGEAAGAEAMLARAVELAPVSESAHRGLVRALLALGRRGDAALAYRRCVEALERLAGTSPSPATRALEAKIRER